MDECIRSGVSTTSEVLPGRLGLARRAPKLYRRLMKGFYPTLAPPPPAGPAIPPPSSSSPSSSGNGNGNGDALLPFDPLAALSSLSARAEGAASDAPPSNPYIGRNGGTSSYTSTGSAVLQRRRTQAPRVMGQFDHPIPPMPTRKALFPGVDFLSCYAIAVNEGACPLTCV